MNINDKPEDQIKRCKQLIESAPRNSEFVLESDANLMDEFDIRCMASLAIGYENPAHIESAMVDHITDMCLGVYHAVQAEAAKWVQENHSEELSNNLNLHLDGIFK